MIKSTLSTRSLGMDQKVDVDGEKLRPEHMATLACLEIFAGLLLHAWAGTTIAANDLQMCGHSIAAGLAPQCGRGQL